MKMITALTFELSKEENYLLPDNPSWIYVITDPQCHVPRYRVFVSYSPICSSYYIKLLYRGKDVGLPENMCCSNRVFVAMPEQKALGLLVLVETFVGPDDDQKDVMLCFARIRKKTWKIYVYDKCQRCNESCSVIFRLLAYCPDSKKEEVSEGRMHRIYPGTSTMRIYEIVVESRIARDSTWNKIRNLNREIWARIMAWIRDLREFVASCFTYFWNDKSLRRR